MRDEGNVGTKLRSLIRRIGANRDTQPEWAADIERQIEATLTRRGFRPQRR